MQRFEGWGFLALMSCMVCLVLSLSLFTGTWQVAGCIISVLLGILSGGLYAASAKPKLPTNGCDTPLIQHQHPLADPIQVQSTE